ncbi:hypothetical protein AYWB_345 [Aster yellows witches'-broom phytoplasma AYWB]|uniref:Uncharacterized protein n=1 Tax=Aster yellows witches'-broom phytoplasma (strain AYWB) TaxID=322098 RepID=Q2NJD1_AYWBP|nr:hypothetical protein AYWB_345 [Aster yellows witches'-broom phytoplasma AYWB]
MLVSFISSPSGGVCWSCSCWRCFGSVVGLLTEPLSGIVKVISYTFVNCCIYDVVSFLCFFFIVSSLISLLLVKVDSSFSIIVVFGACKMGVGGFSILLVNCCGGLGVFVSS